MKSMEKTSKYESIEVPNLKPVILQKNEITLIPATGDELELIMAWRSHPEVYRYFFHQDSALKWEEHYQFWTSRKDRIDWMINYTEGGFRRKVGCVSVSNLSTNTPEIGVLIGEITLMGKGVGKTAVGLVVDWLERMEYSQVHAYISKKNIASQRLFSSLGFKFSAEIHDGKEWVFLKSFEDKE